MRLAIEPRTVKLPAEIAAGKDDPRRDVAAFADDFVAARQQISRQRRPEGDREHEARENEAQSLGPAPRGAVCRFHRQTIGRRNRRFRRRKGVEFD